MTRALDELDIETLHPDRLAVFLDFDGTLVEIVARPELVELAPTTHAILDRLKEQLSGAIALVTGRELHDLEVFVDGLDVAAAAVHGMIRKSAEGNITSTEFDSAAIERVEQELVRATAEHDGLLLERKDGSVALHYRQRPDLKQFCRTLAENLTEEAGSLTLTPGKMVFEIRAASVNKGTAIADFLSEEPFAGRTPLFAGDDVTDEDGFMEVNRREGLSIKIGDGATQARYRAPSTAAFIAWLDRFSAGLSRSTSS